MLLDFSRKAIRWLYLTLITIQVVYFSVAILPDTRISWYHLALAGCILLYDYAIREAVSQIWQIIVLNVIPLISVIIIPGTIYVKVVLCLLIVVITFTSSRYLLLEGKMFLASDMPVPAFVVGFVTFLAGDYIKRPDIMSLATYLPIILFMIFLVANYLDGLVGYIRATKDVTGIPINRIIKSNSLIIVCIMIVSLVSLALGDALGLGFALKKMLGAVFSIVKNVLKIIMIVLSFLASLFAGKGGIATNNFSTSMMALELQEEAHSDFADIVNAIMKVLFLIIVAVVVFSFLIWFVRMILRKHDHTDKIDDIAELGKKDKKERTRPGFFVRLKEYLSMEERARRIYKKRILSFKDDYKLSESLTTGQIRDGIKLKTGKELSELTVLYDKVRYGFIDVDTTYLKKMKNADRQEKDKVVDKCTNQDTNQDTKQDTDKFKDKYTG